MSFRSPFTAAAVFLGAAALTAAQPGTVSGKVTAKGLRTSADIVVSLEASGLKVTAPKAPVEFDQKQMKFIPHVLPVVVGTTVRFLNSDTVAHNVFSPEGGYNLGTWPPGQSKDHVFKKPGVYTQLCQVHPEMEGYVVVLDTPYFATTNKSGAFEIKDVAPGKYKLVAWSEKLKRVEQDVTVETGKPTTANLTMSK